MGDSPQQITIDLTSWVIALVIIVLAFILGMVIVATRR